MIFSNFFPKKSVRKLTEIQWEKLTGIVFLHMAIMCLTFPQGSSKKIISLRA